MRPVKWYKGVAPVAVFKDRQVLGYKNGRLCKMDAEGKITNICSLPRSFFERITESSRLLRRMFRRDVRCACFSASGDVFFFKDKTLYRYADTRLQKICPPEQGMSAPLNIAPALEASGYEVLWGDYSSNDDRREVRIWGAGPDGTAAVVYRFPAGCLRHVHNIIPDRKGNGYYILTGDND
ncbi:MAG: hypothetical protein ILO36_04190, partial [Abditibacteriota bacterium]|nr:hypothetical protein [Abditibacteriota bacterium]